MRLSEAIRLGSMLGKQIFGAVQLVDSEGIHTCAIGAARQAGYAVRVLDAYRATMPECGCSYHLRRSTTMYDVIVHLNDTHRWSREAIAAWVETVEEDSLRRSMEVAGVEVSA